MQFSASVVWEYWGCGDVVQALDQLMDDYMENSQILVFCKGILVLIVAPGIILFIVLSEAVHLFLCFSSVG